MTLTITKPGNWLTHRAISHRWLPKLLTAALVTASLPGLGMMAPPALAVETIQITYGDLEAPPISLDDLEEFARTGIPSRDLQMVLSLLRLEEAKARELLTQDIPVDVESLREVSESFIGQFLWRLASTTISTDDDTREVWELMQEAVFQVANSGRITILDVLRSFNTSVLRIDSQRVMAIASQIRPEDIRILSSIFLGE